MRRSNLERMVGTAYGARWAHCLQARVCSRRLRLGSAQLDCAAGCLCLPIADSSIHSTP